jgi:hypothetical protein
MACEVKYNTSHHAGATPEARIASRLRNSGDAAHADHQQSMGQVQLARTLTSIILAMSNTAKAILARATSTATNVGSCDDQRKERC